MTFHKHQPAQPGRKGGYAAMAKKSFTLETLPEILTAQNIADFLSICRQRVYELFQLEPNEGGIPNFNIGLSRRVVKQDFLNWIDARRHAKAEKNAS